RPEIEVELCVDGRRYARRARELIIAGRDCEVGMRVLRLDVGPDLRDHVAGIARDVVFICGTRIADDREPERRAVVECGIGLRDDGSVVGWTDGLVPVPTGDKRDDDEIAHHRMICTSEFTPAPANEIGWPDDGSVNVAYGVVLPVAGSILTTWPVASWVKPI